MDSEDGEYFTKQLAAFVRTHEKALANALQFQRREPPPLPERPSTSSSTSNSLAAAFSFGPINFTSHNVKSAKLALTPHHLFYLLSRIEELGINVGPMKVRLENLHESSNNYVSFLGNTGRSRSRSSDVGSIHSVSSMRSVMSGMSALWASFGIGASISAARTERHKAAVQADLKYLYSAFTKIPCLRLAPDWRARLIRGYEEFPFDSAVPLYVFKNLQALEVNSIDFRQFFGWDRLADQLRSLSLRHAGIEDPADILIDIVLDDMDKRRRRTSKSQSSPTATLASNNSPRRSPTIPHPDLIRAASAPGEPAVEDTDASDATRTSFARDDTDGNPRSPTKRSRPRSSSPTRPASSRNHSSNVRTSQRIKRSGSGSSHSSMSDSWHHHARGSSSNLLAMGILPASKWRFLRHLSLADNAITSIQSTSLAPLSNTLFSLDLSSNLFGQIPDSLATLTALRALNLSHCMIDSLHSLTRNPLPAITALNLRANRLQSLAGVEKLYPLERLDLRDNRLTDPLELARLTGIPDLREIWVEGNPFTRTHKDYRTTIFNLFRATPGYTVDIVIDGCGPSYSERRLLIERAPIPDSVPVVKPKSADAPAAVEERPTPKTVTSEINTGSARRRKASKRRIVDLARGDAVAPLLSVDLRNEAPPTPDIKVAAISPPGNYRISRPAESVLLPPVITSESRSGPPAVNPDLLSPDKVLGFDTSGALAAGMESQDWDVGGEVYRRKIQTLRDRVGSGYLSVLSEESWDGTSSFNAAGSPSVPPLRAGHMSSNALPTQAVHSGRTVG
ncbi:leucine rich repeat domain-containing protein [Hirsutella rhossiliensis]|uniref:Leucine rich repeat domain-containing protein n=1 Tax=Hirsutella rhossiliensis TaxID=111463 RepID=A0A9P8SLX9_9HYPO|nr:leucine rich repeat domain-containing protein [Hirsutella rhossiliensis]KAH0966754.1 leucine rich repeat domain-containing protein [Hirsutella rhossiliensis]